MNFTKKLSVITSALLLLTSSLVRAESPESNDRSTDNSGWIGGTVTDKDLGDTIGLRCTGTSSVVDPEHEGKHITVCSEVHIVRAPLGNPNFLEVLSPSIKIVTLMDDARNPGFDADDRTGLYHLTAKSYAEMFGDNGDFGGGDGALTFVLGALIGYTEIALLWGPVTDTVLMPIQLASYGIRRLHNVAVEKHFQKNVLRLIVQKNINTPISHRHFVQFENSIQEMNSIQAKALAKVQAEK